MSNISLTFSITITIIFVSLCYLSAIQGNNPSSIADEDPLTSQKYTSKERKALRKFRPMVNNILYKDFMKLDEYLIRWLRGSQFDLELAKETLENAVQWRLDNKIDEILNEDFNKFRKDYPVFPEGFDKDGRPIIIYLFGRYDFRKIGIAGETENFKRYYSYIFEHTEQNLQSLPNITDVVTIFDLTGFNRKQFLCLNCLSLATAFVSTYEKYYPQLSRQIYVVNMPTVFEEVMKVIEPLFSEHTRKTVQFFGYDKSMWTEELFKQIPKEQLIRVLGGTKCLNRVIRI